jgi:hypothetical protein
MKFGEIDVLGVYVAPISVMLRFVLQASCGAIPAVLSEPSPGERRQTADR